MSHENSKAMAGSLPEPEEPGMPTTCRQTQHHDVEPVLGNVRTPDAPVSSRLRSTSGQPVTSGTTTLEPYIGLVTQRNPH